MFKLTAIKEKSIGGMFGIGSSSSSGAATNASNAALQAQREEIEFYKQQQAISKPIQDQALKNYASMVNNPTAALEKVKQGGLYSALLSGQEEAALRAQSAVGNLRGGGSHANVGRVQNQALLNAYGTQLQGLQNLSGMGGNYTNQIGSGIGNLGTIQAQGIIGEAQNASAGQQAGFGNLLGLGQLGVGAYSSGMFSNGGLFSDDRLKTNVKYTGEENGIKTCSWDWNEKANDIGLYGSSYGCLASDVEKVRPDAVYEKDGYKMVHYNMIGVKHGEQ